MTTPPNSIVLSEDDLKRTAKIFSRGLYFYDQLASPIVDRRAFDSHEICDLAYHIRSLAEICSGMPLWFRSTENIQALSGATIIDCNHLLVRSFKSKQDAGEPLSVFEKKVLTDASDKYFALCYPDGKTQLKNHRSADDCLIDTNLLTSKLLHQDEFSILGSLENGDILGSWSDFGSRLKKLANFWRKDFVAQCFFVNGNFPVVIAFYAQRHRALPFKLEIFQSEA